MNAPRHSRALWLLLAAWAVLWWRGGLLGWQAALAGLLIAAVFAGEGVSLGRGERAALGAAAGLGLLWTAWARVPQAHLDAVLVIVAALGAFAWARRDDRWTPGRAGLLLLAGATLSAGGFIAAGFIIGEGAPVPYELSGVAQPHIASRWVAPNQNILAAALLAPGIVLAVAAWLRGRRKAWVAALICLVGLVYAGSRAGYIALALGLVWLVLRAPRRREAALAAAAVALLTGLLAWQAPFSKLRLRVQAMADVQERDSNYFRRKDFWKGAVTLSRESPLAGKGLESFANEAWRLDLPTPLEWRNPIARYRMTLEHAHNEWLELAVELGWPAALLAMLAVTFWFAVRLRRSPDLSEAGVEVFVLAVAFHACLDMTLRTPAIVAGLALGLASLHPRSSERRETWKGLRLALALMIALGGAGVWAARRAAQSFRSGSPASAAWLNAAAWLQPLDADVQARRLSQGLSTWPWAAWAGRNQWVWTWAAAQREGRAGREDGAVEGLRRCTELRPFWAPGWMQLGVALERTGHASEASLAVDRALELEPNFGRARAWRCQRLAAQGRAGDARRELEAIHGLLELRVQREEPSEYTLYIQYVDPTWLSQWDRKLGLSTSFRGHS